MSSRRNRPCVFRIRCFNGVGNCRDCCVGISRNFTGIGRLWVRLVGCFPTCFHLHAWFWSEPRVRRTLRRCCQKLLQALPQLIILSLQADHSVQHSLQQLPLQGYGLLSSPQTLECSPPVISGGCLSRGIIIDWRITWLCLATAQLWATSFCAAK